MSGHSKWATIKHKKGAADARRGRVFSRLAREIMVVARQGGGDPAANAALRNLLQKARSVNMPGENIERAIKKGTGELGGVTYEEVAYEGYAAGGVGVIVKVLTDNKNRAAAEIRNIFRKHGTDFASVGAVSRGFERKGQIVIDAAGLDEDRVMEIALEAGADDMINNEGESFEILCQPQAFSDICEALGRAGIRPLSAEAAGLLPVNPVPIADIGVARAVGKFVAALEEHDDVQGVYTNMEVDDAIAEQLAGEE
jgi:YebC/PmpR family DNA-binding regulatory protein